MRGTCLEQQVMITNNLGLLFTLLVYDAASSIPPLPICLLTQFKDYIKPPGAIVRLRGRLTFNLSKYSCFKSFAFRLIWLIRDWRNCCSEGYFQCTQVFKV